jgi:OOP family OmpA-OmpF porin
MKKRYSVIQLKKKMLPVLLAVVFLFPLAAHAEIKAKSFELSPFIGYHFFEEDQNLEDDFVFGGRVGYNITNRFAIEGALEFINTSVDDKNQAFTTEGQFTTPITDVDMMSYHLDVLYHFMPESNFNPFLAAGYGAAHYSPKINDEKLSVISYGAGAKYWLAENIGLRADLRDNLVLDETFHNVEATLGVIFRFGGDSEAEAAPVVKHEPAAKPVKKAEKKVVATPVEQEIAVLRFMDVHFNFDQSALKPEAERSLDKYIKDLKENPGAKIRIEGYTSEMGTEEYNQTLSKERADAVKSYLVNEGGIESSHLKTSGYGETDPKRYEANPDKIKSKAAKKNMRVLFEIVLQ